MFLDSPLTGHMFNHLVDEEYGPCLLLSFYFICMLTRGLGYKESSLSNSLSKANFLVVCLMLSSEAFPSRNSCGFDGHVH